VVKLFPQFPYAGYTAGAAAAVITNTVGVLGMILVFNYNRTFGSIVVGWQFIGATILANSLIELAVCVVVAPPIVLALKKALKLDTSDLHKPPQV
jgi:uncharacterized membrane protein